MKTHQELREEIRTLVAEYHHARFQQGGAFIPGKTPIPVSGKVFDELEIQTLIDSSLDFWLTTGRFAAHFKREFGKFMGHKHVLLTTSGSSANLLAIAALTAEELGERRLMPGDEVITVAAGFPTTVNPMVQYQLIPVFVDVTLPTYNIDVSQLERALSPKTKAIMVAHTLGNPFDIETVRAFATAHNLWMIEDNCDAVGSTYNGQMTGTFGDMATVSFYPAHHITMGEGGAVLTNDDQLQKLVGSFKNWGRDCWCAPGACNTCGKRFEWELGDLPYGYDHKYIFSHVGYNLKITDMQAAVGFAQLSKLPAFIQTRKENFRTLYTGLQDLQDFLLLPEATPHSDPSWFGFTIAVKKDAPFSRNDLVNYLENHHIATRMLFSGNLVRQPAYKNVPKRIIGDLSQTDIVMNDVFWIGTYPGLTPDMLAYVIETFHVFCKKMTEGSSGKVSIALER
jgi:CDP-6-deoxy-D-xylo-4-hexulose-3-dehydrase